MIVAAHGVPTETLEVESQLRAAGLPDSQIGAAKAGVLVTRLIPATEDNAAFVAGAVRISSPTRAFAEEIRHIGVTLPSPEGRVLQSGRFKNPPSPEDLQPLRVEGQDLKDLRRCRVGDCDVQVGRHTMDLARGMEAPRAGSDLQAEQLVKSILLERARAYLRNGSQAMAIYDDGTHPESAGAGFARILSSSTPLLRLNPSFYEYLRGFPVAPRPTNLEDFVYWSKDRVLKPVVSIVHALLQSENGSDGPCYFVALKHIYDSHYFLAYVEFQAAIPERGSTNSFYLVRSVRALINPPRGLFRGLLLGRIKRAMRDQLGEDMARAKERLEAAARSAPR